MLTQPSVSLLNLPAPHIVVPMVATRAEILQALALSHVRALLLRDCNLFDLAPLIENAQHSGRAIYLNIDHVDGVNSDVAGLRYVAEQMHVTGIVSNHPKVLSLGKQFGLETIQRIFAVDSTGLEVTLASVDVEAIDMLDFSPALVLPHIIAAIQPGLGLPYMASGLLNTARHLEAVMQTGVSAVGVSRLDLVAAA